MNSYQIASNKSYGYRRGKKRMRKKIFIREDERKRKTLKEKDITLESFFYNIRYYHFYLHSTIINNHNNLLFDQTLNENNPTLPL